jgi:hypothetical protein
MAAFNVVTQLFNVCPRELDSHVIMFSRRLRRQSATLYPLGTVGTFASVLNPHISHHLSVEFHMLT